MAVACLALGQHLPVGDVEGGKQCGCTVPLVVVGNAVDVAEPHRQNRLGALERLDLMGWMAPSRHRRAKLVAVEVTQPEPSTMEITTIGLDLAKHVFQIHGVDGRATSSSSAASGAARSSPISLAAAVSGGAKIPHM